MDNAQNSKKIIFAINKMWDLEVFPEFIVNGYPFFEYVIKSHYPDIVDHMASTLHISKYIDNYYLKYNKELVKAQENAKEKWLNCLENFNNKISEVFKDFKFIPENIYCFTVINPASTRFIDDKSFIFFYKENPLHVIPHELLHFYFFEYTKTKHSSIFLNLNTDEGAYHKLSEIFNNVILDEEFYKIFGGKFEVPYDVNISYKKEFTDLFYSVGKDIDKFILKGFDILRSKFF